MIHVIYLHGFASSAQSSKAAFFRTRLAAHGVQVVTPDFNEPDFSTLTVTRMLQQVQDAISSLPTGPVALVGSSLGGFVAVNAAVRHPERIERLVLLAPALDFDGNRLRDLGDRGVDEWQRTNRLDVFHYGFGRLMPVHYGLYEDAARYDAFDARVDLPVQVFQGLRDASVDPESVRRWSAVRPNVELHLLDDDHQLHASLETIWTESARFLGVRP
ncbi:MAG: YqiA/YcfP family alpha/beta fold hydrolase [Vicinamibacterales bacterium]